MVWQTFFTTSGPVIVQRIEHDTSEIRFPQCSPEHLLRAEPEIMTILTSLQCRHLVLNAASMMYSMPASLRLATKLVAELQKQACSVTSDGFWMRQTSLKNHLSQADSGCGNRASAFSGADCLEDGPVVPEHV